MRGTAACADKELNGVALTTWLLQGTHEDPWTPLRLAAVEVRNNNDVHAKAKI